MSDNTNTNTPSTTTLSLSQFDAHGGEECGCFSCRKCGKNTFFWGGEDGNVLFCPKCGGAFPPEEAEAIRKAYWGE